MTFNITIFLSCQSAHIPCNMFIYLQEATAIEFTERVSMSRLVWFDSPIRVDSPDPKRLFAIFFPSNITIFPSCKSAHTFQKQQLPSLLSDDLMTGHISDITFIKIQDENGSSNRERTRQMWTWEMSMCVSFSPRLLHVPLGAEAGQWRSRRDVLRLQSVCRWSDSAERRPDGQSQSVMNTRGTPEERRSMRHFLHSWSWYWNADCIRSSFTCRVFVLYKKVYREPA